MHATTHLQLYIKGAVVGASARHKAGALDQRQKKVAQLSREIKFPDLKTVDKLLQKQAKEQQQQQQKKKQQTIMQKAKKNKKNNKKKKTKIKTKSKAKSARSKSKAAVKVSKKTKQMKQKMEKNKMQQRASVHPASKKILITYGNLAQWHLKLAMSPYRYRQAKK